MAQISLSISSEYESSFVIQDYKSAHGLISILIETNLPGGTPYTRDWVLIHGTDADLREFARRISAAFPPDEQQAREETDEREESAREDAEQYETGAMRCPPRE
jgi:hypothetical protein